MRLPDNLSCVINGSGIDGAISMSDSALSVEGNDITDQASRIPKRTSAKYNPDKDRERMRLWMKDQRAADKAGFTGRNRVLAYRASKVEAGQTVLKVI